MHSSEPHGTRGRRRLRVHWGAMTAVGVGAGADVGVSGGVVRSSSGGRPAWLLRTARSSMLLCLATDQGDVLAMPHWGAAAADADADDYLPYLPTNRRSEDTFQDGQPLAYPVFGLPTFKESALVVARPDGTRAANFVFAEDRLTAENQLEIVLRDTLLHAELTLRFVVYPELDLIVRSAEIRNRGDHPLTLERALSAALALPPDDYDLVSLHGQWGREFQLLQRPLQAGRLTLGSTRGLSSHETHPWFAIRPRGETAEHHGAVWFGSLAWSGNWVAVFDVERNDAVNIVCGLQPFDFSWRLDPGHVFTTPELVCGYTENGLGGASHCLHAFEEHLHLPASHRDRLRPVLYNSWEATYFDVTARGQMELARTAAEMGVELFVVDDGWFGERHSDHAALGDWSVNATKFPNGLRELIDEVHRLGMQFGIWVEPEMINPDSDLYRAHPDWAFHVEGKTPTLARNQMVLNFARQDVRDAIYARLHDLLSSHGRIEFIKWDHNRAWTDVGWPEQPDRQREAWVRHVFGLYDMLRRLREAFPHVQFETCAGGGGRADLGMLRLTDQAWTSDNTDAADRLTIQYGFSRAHSPRVMTNWVTDVPNHQTGRIAPLEFRFHVAMQGVFGIGGDLTRWADEERAEARRLVQTYKDIRPLVQHGRQYWLRPPQALGTSAVQYVSHDGSATAVLLYQVRGVLGQGVRRLRLHGLTAERRYRRDDDGTESTGAALMGVGIPALLPTVPGARQPLDWRSSLQVWRAAD